MKKLFLCYFLGLFSFFTSSGQNTNNITIGKIDNIHSEILNEDRKIWIHVPDSNSQDGVVFAKKSYPVLYVLDGDGHFTQMVGMLNSLSTSNICPKMIVVGITNTNRTRDLTPTKVKENPPYINKAIAENSGGGANFMSFIEKELIPYIDNNYPTDPYKMFVGHSFGGLTVMNTLIETPNLFDSYVAIDPSMSWADNRLLKKIKKTNFNDKYKNKSLYLSIANSNKEMDLLSIKKDTTYATQHTRSILELDDYLKKDSQNNLSYKSKFYPTDNHGSVVLISEYDALRHIFDFYNLDLDMDEFINPEINIFTKVVNHYQQLSKIFRIEKKPSEEFINNLGYALLSLEQFNRAEKFFKLNTTNYPNSFNAYDSLGDLYIANGEEQKAIESFKKSVSLNKDSYSKAKLKKLLKE